MNNIAIAHETIKITGLGEYRIGEDTVQLPKADYDSVTVITPDSANPYRQMYVAN